MTTRKSGAERQAAYRERHRDRLRREAVERRDKQRIAALYACSDDPCCACCGETCLTFLRAHGARILCRNCEFAEDTFGFCPHQPGISRRLG